MIRFQLNGNSVTTGVNEDAPLLYVLRNDFSLNGPKFGCGASACGACTVLVNGQAVRSCITPVSLVADSEVVSLEDQTPDSVLSVLQQAFLVEQAAQCGYCSNGMILTATELLSSNPAASDAEIRESMDGILCRCGAQARVLKAIKRAQVQI
ncbi:Isoquinoline 1-oxidoreductase subunit alpha [Pseudovibrio sp. Ad46]|uniref:(2Fe-2S)-binding protein n=1 Tax=unclassified Pseudovibrio TaxID=2627060 RepID=UPI0007AE6620|nr:MULTISPECIES: (2Fe-2S)-binding protein [unclassified Pseudovibrio]KZK92504.1 Isoquinoline 1-oxidoreductase subunit alpha [Pseudovibrio sp. Ad46]KZK97264.1 Isoquinoline 1-oxidoreductase subunit alpha [Pseudovibrio sp. Ad5]KZL26609.1 Isoquinoline 1-oxidoreductase subunit alpha [Pseudovibrio sp. Ad37]KZL27776.1 Isoquinoline 1-oxidoreductase subunit alpha [Pseudovibrio sp. WM33]